MSPTLRIAAQHYSNWRPRNIVKKFLVLFTSSDLWLSKESLSHDRCDQNQAGLAHMSIQYIPLIKNILYKSPLFTLTQTKKTQSKSIPVQDTNFISFC